MPYQNKKLLKHLFSPLKINTMVIPNRLMMSGMHLGMDTLDDIYKRMSSFYSLRAKGNVGLIFVGGCSPNTAGKARLKGNFSIESDDQIPLHRKITDAVHQYDSKIGLQICHFGRESFHGRNVCASAVRAEGILYKPREMTEDVIWETISDFGNAARRARESGYDAVEIVGSQGFLLHQFLSRSTNKRTDKWGGSFDNRLRFTLEVLTSARKNVGKAYPVIYRLPALDLIDQGNSLNEVKWLHKEVNRIGVDLINVGIGWHDSKTPTIEMSVPRAAFSLVARYIKHIKTDIPVAVSNRINDPLLAEELLLNNMADVIAMGRPLLADPNFMRKAGQNKFDKINTCIACNQGCLDHALTGKRVCCMVNPDCGFENEGVYLKSFPAKKIGVIGGGIAGMRSALTLAKRGNKVILYEKDKKLGGQLLLASRIPGKKEFLETIKYYQNALMDQQVEIILNHRLKRSDLKEKNFDHLVLATGFTPKKLNIEGDGLDHVFTYEELLKSEIPVPSPIVIVGAGAIALNMAYYFLKKKNRLMEISENYLKDYVPSSLIDAYKTVEMTDYKISILNRSGGRIGKTIGSTTRWVMIKNLQKSNIKTIQRVQIKRITDKFIEIEQKGKKTTQRLRAKTVVCAIGQTFNDEMEKMAKELNIPYSVVGPVISKTKKMTYNAMIAIKEGDRIAKKI